MKRSAAYTLLTQVAMAAAAFVVNIVAARALGPDGRGAAYLAVMVPSLLALLATAGLANAFVRFVAADPREAPLARSVLHWATGVAVIATIPVIWLAEPIAAWIGIRDVGLLRMATPIFAFQTYQVLTAFLLLGLGRIGPRNTVLVTQAAAYLFIAPILLAIEARPAALVMALGSSYAISCLAAFVALRGIGSPWAGRGALGTLRRYTAFGLKGQVGQIAQYLNYRLDALILGGLVGPAAVGVYAIATSVADIVAYVSNAAATVAFPMFAKMSDLLRVSQIVRLTVIAASLVGLCAAVIGAAAIPWVYGEAFAASVLPFLLLIPGTIALAVVKMLSAFFVAKGQPGRMTLAAVASLVVAVSLDLLLIPVLGPVGAAVASTAAYVVGATACLWLFSMGYGGRVRHVLWPQPGDLQALWPLSPRDANSRKTAP